MDIKPSIRLRINISGIVQGIGFRPFVSKLADEKDLKGWIRNTSFGAQIEVEGSQGLLDEFIVSLHGQKPSLAYFQSFEPSFLDPVGYSNFEIRPSLIGEKTAMILPDIATCPECLKDIFDPDNRRYLYPFTNCTLCGPRYSIIQSIPYDRANTSMHKFSMCPECQAEYDDPGNRRFHAQPNACSVCGPQMKFTDQKGEICAQANDAITLAVEKIQQGKIIALKGIGGFQLIVDALNDTAINELRARKRRGAKPFAVMFAEVDDIHQCAHVSSVEERLLEASEAPIVILKKKNKCRLPESIAPGNPYLGAFLPYSPLHHILLRNLKKPVVATSGNLSEEPICIDDQEAFDSLGNIADYFLVHDRPIVRHVDDSIVRAIHGREMILRRARGYSPLPVYVKQLKQPVLGVGPHLKNTVALGFGHFVFVSQHIGDLETVKSSKAFERAQEDLQELYEKRPQVLAVDCHPDYLSSKHAKNTSKKTVEVQHHYAHILSCMAENEIEPPVLGVAWDGTGFGLDGTIWGGEFLSIHNGGFARFSAIAPFPLIGGEQAIREPRRSALGILYREYGEMVFRDKNILKIIEDHFALDELETFKKMLSQGINCPLTTSMGRLFDGMASLLDLSQINQYEGQAAMALEFLCEDEQIEEAYSFHIRPNTTDNEHSPRFLIDGPNFNEVLKDIRNRIDPKIIAVKFHNMLVDFIYKVALKSEQSKIVLSGGCFQNKFLLEKTIDRLQHEGLMVYWHQRIPPNDGGISLGQIMAAQNMG